MTGIRLLTVVSLAALFGCASVPSGELARSADVPFAKALKDCRFAYGGTRAVQRKNLPATFPPVAACLKDKGWNSDGTPSIK